MQSIIMVVATDCTDNQEDGLVIYENTEEELP